MSETIGEARIEVYPEVSQIALAKTRAQIEASYDQAGLSAKKKLQNSINEGLAFSPTTQNAILNASAKLEAQRTAALKKAEQDRAKISQDALNERTRAENVAQKAQVDAQKAAQKAQTDALRSAERERTRVTNEESRLRRDIARAEQREQNGAGGGEALATRIRNAQTFIPNFVPPAVTGLTALPSVLSTISNLLPLVNAGFAVMPAAIAGAGVAAGVLAIALSGVTSAWTALDNSQTSVGQNAATQAKQLATAQDGVRNATRSLTSAREQAKKSQQDELDAQQALNDAYQTATNRLDDLTLAKNRDALSLKQAQKDQAEASIAYQNALSTGDQTTIQNASDALDNANQSLAEAQQQAKETGQEYDKAFAKGVNGSDEVVKAQRALVDAQQAVRDSNDRVTDAVKDLADAQQNLKDTMTGATGAAAQLQTALDQLTPSARELVTELHAVFGPGSDLFKGIQENFFKPLIDSGFIGQVKGLIDAAKPLLDGLAKTLGSSIGDVFKTLTSGSNLSSIKVFLQGVNDFFKDAAPGMKDFLVGLEKITTKGGSLGGEIGSFAGKLLSSAGDFLSKVDVAGLLNAAKPVLEALTQLGKNSFSVLSDLLKIASNHDVLNFLVQLTQTVKSFVESKQGQEALGQLFSALNSLGGGVAKILGEVLDILGTVLVEAGPFIGPFVDAFVDLLKTLKPLAEPLGKIVSLLLVDLAGVFKELTPFIGPILQDISTFLDKYLDDAISFMSTFFQNLPSLTPLFDSLSGALNDILGPLGDIIPSVLDNLKPYLPEFGRLVGELANNFGALYRNLGPLWEQVLKALAPVMPQLASAWGQFAIAMAQLLVAVTPLVDPITKIFTLLLGNRLFLDTLTLSLKELAISFQLIADGITATINAYNSVAKFLHLPTIGQPAEAKKIAQPAIETFGAKGFADGGYTGDGGVFQPAGVVHAGEYVLPQTMSAIFPLMEAVRQKMPGYSSGGSVVPRISRGYAGGGYVSGGGSTDAPDVNVRVFVGTKEIEDIATEVVDDFGKKLGKKLIGK